MAERDKKVLSPKFLDSDFNIAHMIMFSRSSGYEQVTSGPETEQTSHGVQLSAVAFLSHLRSFFLPSSSPSLPIVQPLFISYLSFIRVYYIMANASNNLFGLNLIPSGSAPSQQTQSLQAPIANQPAGAIPSSSAPPGAAVGTPATAPSLASSQAPLQQGNTGAQGAVTPGQTVPGAQVAATLQPASALHQVTTVPASSSSQGPVLYASPSVVAGYNAQMAPLALPGIVPGHKVNALDSGMRLLPYSCTPVFRAIHVPVLGAHFWRCMGSLAPIP